MKFGVNTLIWRAAFGPADFSILPRIKARGFDGIEIPIFDPDVFQPEIVGRELDRIGLARTACTVVPRGSGLGSSDVAERRGAIAHLGRCIAAARDAG